MEMEITTLIVDDEPAARRRVRMLLKSDPAFKVIGESGDGLHAAEMIRNLRPALVFLDVQIPGADGFGVLEQLAKDTDGELPAVVFVTAHREYALPAFEAHALDYLLKPFRRSRFFDVLERAKTHLQQSAERAARQSAAHTGVAQAQDPAQQLLLIKSSGRLLFLKMCELQWIEAERDYLRLHFAKESHFVRDTMRNFQRRLDPHNFLRIHRSTIVNVNEIAEILPLLAGDYTVILRDKTQLTLSRRFRPALDDFLRRRLATLPKSV